MSDSLSVWAEELCRKVFEFWKDEYRHWEPGFQVWYGPVDRSKHTLILGVQPGGDAASFETRRHRFESGEFSLPPEHDYDRFEYDLANRMQTIVSDTMIDRSIKTNLNFFRAPSVAAWQSGLDERSRREIEEYCFDKIETLVHRMDPELIITEGTASVYDRLQSEWRFSTDRSHYHTVGNHEERLVCEGRTDDFTVIGLKHPSSGRGLGETELRRMREFVENARP